MQYEIILFALTAFGGLLLAIPVYRNRQAIKEIRAELAEWEKDATRD